MVVNLSDFWWRSHNNIPGNFFCPLYVVIKYVPHPLPLTHSGSLCGFLGIAESNVVSETFLSYTLSLLARCPVQSDGCCS